MKSQLLGSIPGIAHGFGDRAEPIPAEFVAAPWNWNERKPLWRQVHGVACAEVRAESQECGEVDALWTRERLSPIAVVTADCVPVLMAHRSGRAIAAIHAGWRGTYAKILRELWAKLAAAGEKSGDWVAAIGPSIGPCCYEVSEELTRDFALKFSSAGPNVAVPRRRILDLPAINASELKSIGLSDVDVLRACTLCTKLSDGSPKYHSFRREGGGTRQFSMIGRKQS